MYLAGKCEDIEFPRQVTTHLADDAEKEEIKGVVSDFCKMFELDADKILSGDFTIVTPDSKNPFKQMYVAN